MSNNLVILTGNLGRDPEIRYTGTGKAVTDLSLAVSSGFGENKKTEWFTVTLWGGLAERAGETLKKGSRITVTGKLAVEEYTNKEGNKVTKTKVVANSLGYVEEKESGKRTEAPRVTPVDESDIPF